MLYTCTRCRQATIPPEFVAPTDRGAIYTVPPVCASCREQDRKPQGESVRLFEPAPNQIPGQLSIERPRLVRERDECACGACGAVIPNTLDGTLYNRFHAPHCEFHAG